MAIGTLSVNARLDNPDKIYFGNSEPVECHAVITYNPKTKKNEAPPELFGPLKITVCFQGRAKSKIVIRRSNGQTTTTSVYRSEIPLFSLTSVVYNDSFRSQPGKTQVMPFLLNFPEMDNATVSCDWGQPSPFFTTTRGPLPPSIEFETSGRSHFKTYVKYQVGLIASMPGLQLDIKTQDIKSQPTIRYDHPQLPSPKQQRLTMHGESLTLQNTTLLPEDQRPHGFSQKTKAFFTQHKLPFVFYSWTVSSMGALYVGQPIALDVSLRVEQCTAQEVPVVLLSSLEVRVKSHINVRTPKHMFNAHAKDEDAWAFALKAKATDQSPFSKANGWTKRFITPPLPYMASTFGTYNVSLTYRISTTLNFYINDKLLERKVKCNVTVRPPLPPSQQPLNSIPPSILASGSLAVGESSSSAAAANATLPSYIESSNDTVVPAPTEMAIPVPEYSKVPVESQQV